MPLPWFEVEVAWTADACLCSCFRLKPLMKAVWWWGRRRWSLSHILKELITASLPCDMYSVSSNTKFQSRKLFYFVHIFPHWYLTNSLIVYIRWRYWHWKDHVFVSRPALLLLSGLADRARTRWWAPLTLIQSKCTVMWSLESDVAMMFFIAHLWVKNCKELLPSSSRPSRFDQPIQASQWLKNFKITNERFLSKVQLEVFIVW